MGGARGLGLAKLLWVKEDRSLVDIVNGMMPVDEINNHTSTLVVDTALTQMNNALVVKKLAVGGNINQGEIVTPFGNMDNEFGNNSVSTGSFTSISISI